MFSQPEPRFIEPRFLVRDTEPRFRLGREPRYAYYVNPACARFIEPRF